MADCGLDFGTSNSAIALPGGEVLQIEHAAGALADPRLFRSLLFFPEGDKRIHVGALAVDEYLRDGEGRLIQSIKTWLPSQTFHSTRINNRNYRLQDLVAILLRRIREQGEAKAGRPLTDVVLGRPAVLSIDAEQDALAEGRLREAAELAGFSRIRFVIEPIAAALSYEARLDHEELVLVADFGAGTSDLTLMHLGPERRGRADRRPDIRASGGVRIGGDRFDAEIMRHKLLPRFGAGSTYEVTGKRMPVPAHMMSKLLDWHQMSFIREKATLEILDRMLRSSDRLAAVEALEDLVMENLGYRLFRAIERAKIELSTADETRIDFEEARVHVHDIVTRRDFERFIAPLVAELDACVTSVLARGATETAQVDAVFLTGGSSQIPAVTELFRRRFGAARLRTADAFTSVAEGLGHAATGTLA